MGYCRVMGLVGSRSVTQSTICLPASGCGPPQPKNKSFRSLFGAAQAAERSRDTGKTRALYTKLVSLCDRADTQRPELQQAKAFLRK
jgi:hypothetical protein